MAFAFVNDEGRSRLILRCDAYGCGQDVVGSPDAVLFVPPDGEDRSGESPFFVACGPPCTERLAAREDIADWPRLPFARAMADLIVRADHLPPFVDSEVYRAIVDRGIERQAVRTRLAREDPVGPRAEVGAGHA
jgi:hypothetical protein